MGKSKSRKSKAKVVDDEEAVEEEEAAAEEEAEEEEVQTKAKSRSKLADADDGEDDDASDEDAPAEDDDADAEDAEVAKPRARKSPGMTKTTLSFIVLNWLAVAAFVAAAYMDSMARTQHAIRTVFNYVQIYGLPLRSEEDFPSIANETRPVLRLSSDQLKKAYKARNISITKEFIPVEEPVPLRLRPSDMSSSLKRDIFGSLADPVSTQEDEMDRLKTRIPGDIQAAAKEVLAKLKNDDEKRELVRKVFRPLLRTGRQIDKFEEKIVATAGADLDTLVDESVQRRIYRDILAPVNVINPGDLGKLKVETLADLAEVGDGEKKELSKEFAYKLDDVKEMLVKRLAAAAADSYDSDVHFGDVWVQEKSSPEAMKRDSVVKRRTIAMLMFAIGQVQVPTLDRKLYPKGIERAQVVCGLQEVTSAMIFYSQAWGILKARQVEAVRVDRQGYSTIMPDEQTLASTGGYIDSYHAQVDDLVDIARRNQDDRRQLELLRTQRDEFQKLHEQRSRQLQEIVDKLLTARKNTEKYVNELRARQREMHQALVELSDAAERNFELEARIRRIELDYIARSQKGKKKS
jgi:hypothetical protein